MDPLGALDVWLYDKRIGAMIQLPGDRNLFMFSPEYIENPIRPTLSLSFKDTAGHLIVDGKATQTRLPPFFANLLPEGPLREYLSSQAQVSGEREFYLLRALGSDLPGALTVRPADTILPIAAPRTQRTLKSVKGDRILRFSLAGVQLKFSALWEKGNRLTVPADGIGGAWIIKLPSPMYPNVPENEFAMMSLAKQVGIHVPEIMLLPSEQIEGIPVGFKNKGSMIYAIKRFDRDAANGKIHIEDFAQVFGVYPEKKYTSASYRNIATVIWTETGKEGLQEFIRRFVFNALIGNGDMHLKNWSFIYPDTRTPVLAPAYDFVSTIPYLPNDLLALNFVDSKQFTSLTLAQFKRFAGKVGVPEEIVLDTCRETVDLFRKAWQSIGEFRLDKNIVQAIETHLRTVPL